MSVPKGAITGGTTAYRGGLFTAPLGSSWFACPIADKAGQYLMTAKLPGVQLNPACIGFNARVNDLPPHTVGAWQYT